MTFTSLRLLARRHGRRAGWGVFVARCPNRIIPVALPVYQFYLVVFLVCLCVHLLG
jgi:hypothetical protein